jgi:ABC-type multidrug transport system ATPase subunit
MEYNVLYGTPPLKMLYFLFSKRIPGKIMIVVAKLCNVGLSKSMENAPLLGPTQNLYSMVTYSTMDDVASLNVDPSKLPAVLEYSNIAYKVEERSGNTRDIFHRISFAVKQATLFAITGPSADDNQTLINILGHAKMPGTVYADRMPVLKEEMSFVPEAPELPVFETMFETLVFHAMCSMPANTTFKDQRYRADNVMRLMGLYYLRNCYIGGELSGGIVATGATIGMRRRVAIGCALMKSPHVVIMDQPTRGLSAFDQLEIMEVLKRLSNQGRTVICTINEERYNVVHMLDHIMFMHCGQVVYIGPPTKVIDAFSQATGIKPVGDENPADFGLDCLRGLVHENVVGLIMKVLPGIDPHHSDNPHPRCCLQPVLSGSTPMIYHRHGQLTRCHPRRCRHTTALRATAPMCTPLWRT